MTKRILDGVIEAIKEEEKRRLKAANDGLTNHPGRITFGPDENNIGGPYSQGKGSWDITLMDSLSPDIAHSYLARMTTMYRKVRQPTLTSPIPKKVKSLLLRDRYPVFGSST